MDTAILFFTLSILFSHAANGQDWSCPSAAKCLSFIQKQLNLTESSSNQTVRIDVCLNKQGDIKQCISDATGDCNWSGVEPEFNRLLKERRAVQFKCNTLCSNMEEIRDCADKISYEDYNSQRYDDFCRSYHESVTCKNDTLSENPCSFGEQLFQINFEENIRSVFKYMCYPGCNNVTNAWQVLVNCTRTWKLTDNNCRAYIGLENCLSSQDTCRQIRQMVPYFSPMYEELHISCQRSTLVTETTTSGGIVNRCLAPLTFSVVVSNMTICTAVNCLKMDGMSLGYLSSLRVKESILKLLQDRWNSCAQNRTTIVTVLQTSVKQRSKNGTTTVATDDIKEKVTEYVTDENMAASKKQSYLPTISKVGTAVVDPKADTTTANPFITESTTASEKRGYLPSLSKVEIDRGHTTVQPITMLNSDQKRQGYSPDISTVDSALESTVYKLSTPFPAIKLSTPDKNVTRKNKPETQNNSVSTVDRSLDNTVDTAVESTIDKIRTTFPAIKLSTPDKNVTRTNEPETQSYFSSVTTVDTLLESTVDTTVADNTNIQTQQRYTLEQKHIGTTDSKQQGTTADTTEVHRTVQSQALYTSARSVNKVTRHQQSAVISRVSSSVSTSTVPSPVATNSSMEKISVSSTTEMIQKEDKSGVTPTLKPITTPSSSNLGKPEGQSQATRSYPEKFSVLFAVLICAFFL